MVINKEKMSGGKPNRLFVFGGGVAGLAAAYRYLQLLPGSEVRVLEKSDRFGGLAASWTIEGLRSDIGPHRIYTELPEIEALLPELIAEDQLLVVSRRSELLLQGHFFQYPIRAFELLRHLGVARMGVLGSQAVFAKVFGAGSKDTYEGVMAASFGRGVYDLIVGPYTRKVWKIEPRELSPEVARVRVSAGNVGALLRQIITFGKEKRKPSALKEFRYIRGGVEGLVESLRQKVVGLGGVLETGREVNQLRVEGGKISLAGISDENDAFISTLPLVELAGILLAVVPDAEATQALSRLESLDLLLVALIVRGDRVTKNCWMYYPEERWIFNRAYEPSNFDGDMSGDDKSLIVFEVTARKGSDLERMTDDDLIARVKAEAIESGSVRGDSVVTGAVLRVKDAYPVYRAGYENDLGRVYEYLSQFSNLISTGRQGLFNHNNMDHSMLVGMRASEYFERLGATEAGSVWYGDLGQFSHFRIVD